jgi:FHA domain-containing protein
MTKHMRARESNSSSERVRRPARDVIEAVLANMRENLEPLRYSILAPSRYVVYLHPAEYARLEGIIEVIREQTIRALSEEVGALNRPSLLSHCVRRFLGTETRRSGPQVENPNGNWNVEVLANPDGDIPEGDILVDSELVLPASPDFGIGERTRLVTTVHSARGTTSRHRTVDRTGDVSAAKPPAKIEFDDAVGHHSYDVTDSVIIGRGGNSHRVDIKVAASVDVSREHARIRRDARTGDFFLIDLSTLGTTLDGRHVPRGYDETGGTKRENGAETLLPDKARIGLADTVYISFYLEHP